MIKQIIYVYFVSVFFLFNAFSSETDFDTYLSWALKENAGIQSYYENWQSALFAIKHSASLPNPKLSYGHFIESIETRVGPQKFKVGVSQTIPWLGKLSSSKDIAVQKAYKAELELFLACVDLRLYLIESFLDLFYIQSSIRHQKDSLDLIKVIEKIALSQVKVGGSSADVIQSQMELNRQQYQLQTLEEKERVLTVTINAILNREIDSALSLPLDIDLLLNEPEEELMYFRTDGELSQANPKLKILENEIDIQKFRKKLAHQNKYPDLTVGLDWVNTGKAIMPTPDSGKDSLVGVLSINFPIWRNTYRSQEKEIEAQVNRFSKVHQQYLYDLHTKQNKILYEYSDAKRRIDLFRESLIPEAEKSLSILTDGYRTGRVDFERLQNTQSNLLSLQLSLEKARVDLAVSVARFRALIGE